jgi:hypothetical protein
MAINLRKTDTKTDLELYKEFATIHKEEVEKIVNSVGIKNVDFAQGNLCDESLRFSLLIKKRLEIILEREISFEEMGPLINIMDGVVKHQCMTKKIDYGTINYRRRVELFIEIWKLNELEGYTNEFIYYAREIDREAVERREKERKAREKPTSTESMEFLDDKTYHV